MASGNRPVFKAIPSTTARFLCVNRISRERSTSDSGACHEGIRDRHQARQANHEHAGAAAQPPSRTRKMVCRDRTRGSIRIAERIIKRIQEATPPIACVQICSAISEQPFSGPLIARHWILRGRIAKMGLGDPPEKNPVPTRAFSLSILNT